MKMVHYTTLNLNKVGWWVSLMVGLSRFVGCWVVVNSIILLSFIEGMHTLQCWFCH